MGRATVTAFIVLTGTSSWLAAQQARSASPAASQKAATFDVVSIKPIQPYPAYPNFFVEGDKLRGNHVTARTAIAFAYNVNGRQIIGGPDWIASEHYNIDARAGHRLAPKDASGHLQESVAVSPTSWEGISIAPSSTRPGCPDSSTSISSGGAVSFQAEPIGEPQNGTPSSMCCTSSSG